MTKFFEDLKVVELASVLAGPLIGTFFAELGANVVKIEHPEYGDITRSWKLKKEDANKAISAYYAAANFGKEIKKYHFQKNLDEVLDEIKNADIVISNFKGDYAHKFGLSYEQLKTVNPQLIYLELKGFASDEQRLAFDVVLQAESAYISMTGTSDAYAKMPVAFIDVLAAHQLKEAALIGIIQKMKTGKGSYWKTSLEEVALSSLANQASNYLMESHVPGRMGTLHPNIAPYGDVLFAADQVPFVLAVGNDKHFEQLLELLDLKEILKDWDSNQKRLNNRTELMKLLNSVAQNMRPEKIEEELLRRGIPAGRIRNVKEALETPLAQSMILEELIEGVPTKRLKTFVAQEITKEGV